MFFFEISDEERLSAINTPSLVIAAVVYFPDDCAYKTLLSFTTNPLGLPLLQRYPPPFIAAMALLSFAISVKICPLLLTLPLAIPILTLVGSYTAIIKQSNSSYLNLINLYISPSLCSIISLSYSDSYVSFSFISFIVI